MKKSSLILLLLFAVLGTFAQTGGFNYKALISDNGNVLQNQSVSVRFTFLDNGTEVYKELHASITDENGIVCIIIGDGAVISGDFDLINWGNTISLQVEIDSGSGFADFGTNEFKYVPYAKYADKAGNVFSGDYTDLTNAPNLSTIATSGSYTDLTNVPSFATVATSGSYTDLTNIPNFTGWDTDASDDFSGSYNDLTNVPSFATVATSGSYTDLTNTPNFTGWDTDASDDVTSLNDLSDARVINRCAFIGDNAGPTASSFGDLVGIGIYSLNKATTADFSVSIGNYSLQQITDGSYNTAIGYNSGSNGNGSGNIFIGYSAGAYELGSNKLYIENSDSSLPLIGGDFSTNEVTINGSLSIKDGTQGAGKVLVSDANGKGTWSNIPQQTKSLNLSPMDVVCSYPYGVKLRKGYTGAYIDGTNNLGEMFIPIHLNEGAVLSEIKIDFYYNTNQNYIFKIIHWDLGGGHSTLNEINTSSLGSTGYKEFTFTLNRTIIYNETIFVEIKPDTGNNWDGFNFNITGAKVNYTE